MSLDEELALVARAQAGDRDAVGKLWEHITPKLYGYLMNRLRDTHTAEDILQETWLKAVRNIAKFQPRGVRFSAWLFAIARNECGQHWRREQPTTSIDDEAAQQLQAKNDNTTDRLMIDAVMMSLDDSDKDILSLRYIADLSFQDIARVEGISPIAARVRVHRALRKARVHVTTT